MAKDPKKPGLNSTASGAAAVIKRLLGTTIVKVETKKVRSGIQVT